MKLKVHLQPKRPRLVCTGTGLVALDVVVTSDTNKPMHAWAGGSCGNVLTILAYLGWETFPIARLKKDRAAQTIVEDMKMWGVNTSLLDCDSSGSTPVIVEKIDLSTAAIPRHRFEFVCPHCGAWLPRYRPVPTRDVEGIFGRMPLSQVFFFDRAAPSSIALAESAKSQGALIVFEPSSVKDESLFLRSLGVADILKYSHERLGAIPNITDNMSIPLEIETRGRDGLRYRMSKRGHAQWHSLAPCPTDNLRDSVGAGDWCTAGIIHLLVRAGNYDLEATNQEAIEAALSFGQVLASWNCKYVGARGGMYTVSKQEFRTLISRAWDRQRLVTPVNRRAQSVTRFERFMCSRCPEASVGTEDLVLP